MYTRYNIKARIAYLGKKNVDVIKALNERGVKTNPSEFSQAVNGRTSFPKDDMICNTADRILKEWETEMKAAKGK